MNRSIVWCGAVVFGCVAVGVPMWAQNPVAVAGRRTSAPPTEEVLSRAVTVTLDRVSLKTAVRVIARSSGVRILAPIDLLDAVEAPVTLHAEKLSLEHVFERILTGTHIQAIVVDRDAVKLVPIAAAATLDGVITGLVKDAQTKQPLAGAKITIDGKERAAQTGDNGTFQLSSVVVGTHSLSAKLLGYSKADRVVTVREGETSHVEFSLERSASALDQVVVTGTVIPTELRAIPNAITVITAKQLEDRGITRIDQLFRGDVPGLFAANQGSGSMFDEVTMFSRGATALSPSSAGTTRTDGGFIFSNPIKTYVDGVELADSKYLSQIDPKTIERIEILTGPQASTIYGSNAINGVMQIFTKRGRSSTPQLTLNFLSGWVENNFSPARTPQHDYSAQLDGIEGRFSYDVGGSWNYIGPWTPAKQTTRTSAFGGTRLELPTRLGRVTADATLRYTTTLNRERGFDGQTQTGYQETGWWRASTGMGLGQPAIFATTGQTFGVTLGYAPTGWWSHELGLGRDGSGTEQRRAAPSYIFPDDTTLYLNQAGTDRNSLRYATTLRIPVTSFAQATMTMGGDGWRTSTTNTEIYSSQKLTGQLTDVVVTRNPDHNTGAFLQTQLGVGDQFFLTYGLRAEWNPAFGTSREPNYAPRFGAAYTSNIGALTAKVRASYGRSTRPPTHGFSSPVTFKQVGWGNLLMKDYGDAVQRLANPDLAPEYQQGGEGGVELFFGTRTSLVVTRYNQTVDGLIDWPKVDSVRSFTPKPVKDFFDNVRGADGYTYMYQYQYVNVGSIRNQGWELQHNFNLGPLTTKGTYSWTKSRVIGITPKYRALFARNLQYQPGATFKYVPEHTWALGVTYAKAATTINLNVMGVGEISNRYNDFFYRNLLANRLQANQQNVTTAEELYHSFNRGYAMADLTASQRFTNQLDALVQIQNLANHYTNDLWANYATIGRQVKAGMRLRF